MKVTKRVFTVELTIEEVRSLVGALESEYKYRAGGIDIKELRNSFAQILNRTYSGADA